jgi:hypothetical protein
LLGAESGACLLGAKSLAEMDACALPISPFVAHAVSRLEGTWAYSSSDNDYWVNRGFKRALEGALLQIEGDRVAFDLAGVETAPLEVKSTTLKHAAVRFPHLSAESPYLMVEFLDDGRIKAKGWGRNMEVTFARTKSAPDLFALADEAAR